MNLQAIVEYWTRFGYDESTSQWAHPDDLAHLAADHSLNLDFPTCPYVGRVTTAPVIILGANGGYHPAVTAGEFPDRAAFDTFLGRIAHPDTADWSNVAPYYDTVNWGPLVKCGDAVWVNASPYRSPRISIERVNQRLIARLPSSAFIRRWLLEAALPMAARGERLVIVKRPGLWRLPASAMTAHGVVVDRAAISRHITGAARSALDEFLAQRHLGTGPVQTGRKPNAPKPTPSRSAARPGLTLTAPASARATVLEPGTRQSDVEPLTRVCALIGVDLENPHAPWPGYGKAVHLKGGRSIYLNRRHADVRSGPKEIAQWDAAGVGQTRPDNDRYLRITLDGS